MVFGHLLRGVSGDITRDRGKGGRRENFFDHRPGREVDRRMGRDSLSQRNGSPTQTPRRERTIHPRAQGGSKRSRARGPIPMWYRDGSARKEWVSGWESQSLSWARSRLSTTRSRPPESWWSSRSLPGVRPRGRSPDVSGGRVGVRRHNVGKSVTGNTFTSTVMTSIRPDTPFLSP